MQEKIQNWHARRNSGRDWFVQNAFYSVQESMKSKGDVKPIFKNPLLLVYLWNVVNVRIVI